MFQESDNGMACAENAATFKQKIVAYKRSLKW